MVDDSRFSSTKALRYSPSKIDSTKFACESYFLPLTWENIIFSSWLLYYFLQNLPVPPRLFVPDIHLLSTRKWDDKCEGQLILEPIVQAKPRSVVSMQNAVQISTCDIRPNLYILHIYHLSHPTPIFLFLFCFYVLKLFFFHPQLLIRTPYWSPSGVRGKDYWFWYRLGV